MNYSEYIHEVLTKPRKSSTHNSLGTRHAYRNYVKRYGYNMSEKQYSQIIRTMNQLVMNHVLTHSCFTVPSNILKLYIVCNPTPKIAEIKNGKLIVPYKTDWKRTRQLWETDEESFNQKLQVKYSPAPYFVPKYTRRCNRKYRNMSYYILKFSRGFKKHVKTRGQEIIHLGGYLK